MHHHLIDAVSFNAAIRVWLSSNEGIRVLPKTGEISSTVLISQSTKSSRGKPATANVCAQITFMSSELSIQGLEVMYSADVLLQIYSADVLLYICFYQHPP